MDGLIGRILPWPGTRPPMGWAFCDGAILPIEQYQALFAVIGTGYGGDGVTSFGLPDLRGDLVPRNGPALAYIIALSGTFPAPEI